MFGTRRVTYRLVVMIALVLLVFVYFFINSSHETVRDGLRDSSKQSSADARSSSKRTQVDVVVVEEHHEVLEYWFDAADKGIIPKSGNILIHVDAHSDMAPPEMVDDYPGYRWPKHKHELKAMMQSNDVFIQAATMTGLFKKVIWVWPSWDEDTHEADDITEIFAGGLTVADTNKEQHFCECEFKKDGKTKTECMFVNRSKYSEEADYDGSPIDPEKCDVKKSINYQQIVDHSAAHKMMLGQLVGEGESILLDIDEDFFGCVLRGHRLVNAGIVWSLVEEIDELTNEIFCPELTEKEAIANRFMRTVMALIIKHCKSSKIAALACVTPGNPTSKTFTSAVSRVVESYSEKGIFCSMYKNAQQKRLEMLFEYFIRMTIPQIRACANLGFCMQTSPRSYQENGFQLCHGANEPNTTIVTQHSPGENELLLRLRRLRRMLLQGRYPTPGMVTLCRSVRDGYTSTEYFEDIERHVLKSISESKKHVNFNVIYDINLLGGKKGWPSREITSKKKKN